jgi:hypothetical protein
MVASKLVTCGAWLIPRMQELMGSKRAKRHPKIESGSRRGRCGQRRSRSPAGGASRPLQSALLDVTADRGDDVDVEKRFEHGGDPCLEGGASSR